QLARAVFEYAFQLEILPRNYFKSVKYFPDKAVRELEPFTADEVHAILTTAQSQMPWMYPVVLTLGLTASRRGPIPWLKVCDYNVAERKLIARDEISKQRRGKPWAVPDVLAEE